MPSAINWTSWWHARGPPDNWRAARAGQSRSQEELSGSPSFVWRTESELMRLPRWAGWMSWAQRGGCFSSCFKKSLVYSIMETSWRDGGKDMNLFCFNRKIFFLAHLFYFMTLYYIRKQGSETHPEESRMPAPYIFIGRWGIKYLNGNVQEKKNQTWIIWEESCQAACLL